MLPLSPSTFLVCVFRPFLLMWPAVGRKTHAHVHNEHTNSLGACVQRSTPFLTTGELWMNLKLPLKTSCWAEKLVDIFFVPTLLFWSSAPRVCVFFFRSFIMFYTCRRSPPPKSLCPAANNLCVGSLSLGSGRWSTRRLALYKRLDNSCLKKR